MSNAISRAPVPVNEPVKSYAPGSLEKNAVKESLDRLTNTTLEINLDLPAKAKREHLAVHSPQNHQRVIANVEMADPGDIAAAMKRADSVRADWQNLTWESRAAIFLKAADRLATTYRADICAATMLGQSKTVHQAEIDAACEWIDFLRFNVHFMEQIYAEQPLSSVGTWNRTEVRGLEGHVVAITPFNFTAIAMNLPCSAAMMGCTVLWKPAATSLLSSYLGFKLLKECGLPDGVIEFLPSAPSAFSDLVLQSPDLAGVHFTGSTQTFNLIWQKIANNIGNYKSYPRIVGETGGKDFVFAHVSADVDELATALVRGAFEYQGQKCSAASRAYIPKSLWPALKERLVDITNSIRVGDPADFTNFMGAVIDARSFSKIRDYVEFAKKSPDAKVLVGGSCDDSVGYFVRPTIIETTAPDFKTMREEIFGPVLSIYVYDDSKFAETLKICDQTSPYALTGAVFARDRLVVEQMSAALRNAAGNFYINDKPTGAVVGQQPFGGARASGTNDKAGSKLNLLRWCSMRTVKENFLRFDNYRYPFMLES